MNFTNFKRPCQNVGGILKIFIQDACDVVEDIDTKLTFVKASNFVVPSEFVEYDFTRGSAILKESERNNRNGKLVEYKLTFDIAKATLTNEIEINKLRKSDKVIVIVQDHNRIFRVIGSKCNPATVKVAYSSGKSYGNENIYSIEIESAEIQKPFRLPLPVDPPRPKTNLTVKNTGPSGYVKVEWENNIRYVASNSTQGYFVNPDVSVKITWGIVNLDTGLLDASKINISFPNYAFPSRIDFATFDSVVQNGDTVVSLPDENTVKKARSFTFVMPNNYYFAEIKFRDIKLIDFDFENPVCTGNTANNSPVTTIVDTKSIYTGTQPTPANRGIYTNSEISVSNQISGYGSIAKIVGGDLLRFDFFFHQTVLAIGKILGVGGNNTALPRANNLAHSASANYIGNLNINFRSTWAAASAGFGAVGFEPDFGYRTPRGADPALAAGDSVPFLNININLNKDLYTRYAKGYKCKTRVNFTNHIQPNLNPPGLNFGLKILYSDSPVGGATAKRIMIFDDNLTENELSIIEGKIETKYNL